MTDSNVLLIFITSDLITEIIKYKFVEVVIYETGLVNTLNILIISIHMFTI